MSSLQVSHLVIIVVVLLIVQCDGKAEIGDYIVDCSACNYLPLTKVDSYHCNVRCNVDGDTGEATVNLTSLYDIVTKLSKELAETKRRLDIAEQKLKTDVSFYARLGSSVSVNAGGKIIFKNVISNIGNAYNNVTGIFTIPLNGTYTFTLFTVATDTGNHRPVLKMNDEILSQGHGASGWGTGGCTLNKKLVVGDQVCAETLQTETLHGGYSMFSGNIIHMDF